MVICINICFISFFSNFFVFFVINILLHLVFRNQREKLKII